MQKCRVCESTKLKKIFSLGKQPPANNFLDGPKDKEKSYPLDLYECTHCSLIQLGYVVPKEVLYDNYVYVPSGSKVYLKHLDKLAKELIQKLGLEKESLVVDIGGSDGSFLESFEKRGMFALNVEPAKNLSNKVATIRKYFDKKVAKSIVHHFEKAKLVLSTNAFAHIDDLKEYLEALDILLDEDGVFFAQFPDVRNLLKESQFDTIYHEHLSYFSYESLHHLFTGTPFELWQVTSDNIHGGSMRIWVRRRPALVKEFVKNVAQIKKDLRKLMADNKGKKIVGFGAAAKGTVLLNYCGIKLDYVVDSIPYKQGKYLPGVKTPVYPEAHLYEDPPDIVLILAWNFKEEIMKKLEGLKCKFVVPIPKVEIYANSK